MYKLVEFGNKIKSIRKSLKLSQIDVAEQSGVQRDTLRRLENGHSLPKIDTLDRLSFLYGQDLYAIFSQYRITVDNYISDRIHQMSKDFRNYNYSRFNEEIDLFKETFKDSTFYGKDYLSKKTLQYTVYLESLGNIYSSIKDQSRDHISRLFDSLQLSKKNIMNYSSRLDKLEIRILILLGTIYRYKNEMHSTIDFLNVALDAILNRYKHDNEFIYFYILIQLNRMSFYHRIDNFNTVKVIYEASLSVIDEKIGMNILFTFLIRAGINKHMLKEPHLDGMVQTALQLIKDSGDLPKYKVELNVLKERYPFLNLHTLYDSIDK